MNLSFWNKFSRRGKILLVSVLIAIIAAGSTFAVLYETGIIKFKADTITKNVTVTGKFTDAVTGQPVPNAKIFVGASGRTPANVITKADGSYKAALTINPADPRQLMISVRQNAAGYPTGEETVFTTRLSESSTAPVTFTQNIQLSKAPTEVASSKVLDPVSQRCKTRQGDFIYQLYTVHEGEYYGKEIGGVLFCVAPTSADLIDVGTEDLVKNAAQIMSLQAQTGLSYVPTVYIYPKIDWLKTKSGAGVAGYAQVVSREIHVARPSLASGVRVITHEFGHLVNWEKGADYSGALPPYIDSTFCWSAFDNGKTHCSAAAFVDFGEAFMFSESSGYGLLGYCRDNAGEMFAEMFEAIFDPVGNYTIREKMKYGIENITLDRFGFTFYVSSLSATAVNSRGMIMVQNSAMYIYKFVAKYSNLDEYFPGTVGRYRASTIKNGQYMPSGIVPVYLQDHEMGEMDHAKVEVAGLVAETRLKKTSGVFPDGTGDLFDTTGTAVLWNVPPGKEQIVDVPTPPDYYKGAEFARTQEEINQGGNPALSLYYELHTIAGIQFMPMSLPLSTLGYTGYQVIHMVDGADRTAIPITLGQMTRYPTTGTVGGAVDTRGHGSLQLVVGGKDFTADTYVNGSGGSTVWKGALACGYNPNYVSPANVYPGQSFQYVCDPSGVLIPKLIPQ